MKFFFRLLFCLVIILVMALLYEKYNKIKFSKMIDENPFYERDEIAGFIHSPHFSNKFAWEEHEKDTILFSTNNLGFRENGKTEVKKKNKIIRVFITGDSHTDGVVNNNESFCNLLEDTLNKKNLACKYEFLNAGTGFYSFKNYYGVLVKNSYLQNDMFVVCIYPGNDFIENIIYDDNKTFIISDLKLFWYRLRKHFFNKWTDLASTQHINQLLFFKMYPEYTDQAIDISINYMQKIKTHCDSLNIKLLTVILPTELNANSIKREQLKKYGWNDKSVLINETLTNELENKLKQGKISVLNLSGSCKNNPQMFWKTDQHLSVIGHKKISELIFQNFEWNKLLFK